MTEKNQESVSCVGCLVIMFFIMLGGVAVYVAMRIGWIS